MRIRAKIKPHVGPTDGWGCPRGLTKDGKRGGGTKLAEGGGGPGDNS